jgi:hypothetical protein
LTIPIHQYSREVQIGRQAFHVSVTAFQPVGVYKCYVFDAFSTDSSVYLPGLEHFFHALQGSLMELPGKHKRDDFGWVHREGSVVGYLQGFVRFLLGII